MTLRSTMLALVLVPASAGALAGSAQLAVVPYGSAGSPFAEKWQSGLFTSPGKTHNAALYKRWRKGLAVQVLDANGRKLAGSVRASRANNGDEGDQPLAFALPKGAHKAPMLVWSGDAVIDPVALVSEPLGKEQVSTLAQAGREKMQQMAPQRTTRFTWRLGMPVARKVVESEWVMVRTPVAVTIEGSADDRGWLFQVYSSASGKLACQEFGHPEWTSGDSGVVAVTAGQAFRIDGGAALYMLGEHGSGWEDSEWAIYDLATGKALAVSH